MLNVEKAQWKVYIENNYRKIDSTPGSLGATNWSVQEIIDKDLIPLKQERDSRSLNG